MLWLSRVCCVASLVHMPPWVHSELIRLVFSFFWKDKKDLVAPSVAVQAPSVGGFSVMDVKLKVQSLLVQWAQCLILAFSSWSALSFFCFHSVFNSTPFEVFSHPFAFSPWALPPFYHSLLLAWRSVDGSISQSWSAQVMVSTDPHQFALASSMSARSAYLYLLLAHFVPLHCKEKFFPLYGVLYWSTMWRWLYLCPLGETGHWLSLESSAWCSLYRWLLDLVWICFDPNCFCGAPETPSHLFFYCALAQSALGWIQSLMFRASNQCPSLSCCHVLFGFSASELCVVPRVFVYLLNLAKHFLWKAQNDHHFCNARPRSIPLMKVEKVTAKFHRQWGANRVIGVVSYGSFYCCLQLLFGSSACLS